MAFNSSAQVHLDNPLFGVNKQLRDMFSPLTRIPPYNSVNYLNEMSAHVTDDKYWTNISYDSSSTDNWYRLYWESFYMAYDTIALQHTKDIYSSVLNYYGDTIQLGILDIDYLKMVPGALTSNNYFNFDTVNTVLTDIPHRPAEPYGINNIFAFAPLFHQSNYSTVTWKIDPAYLFKDANNTPYYTSTAYIFQIDFGDGRGFQLINPTVVSYTTITYAKPGDITLTAQITRDGVLRKTSMSKFTMGKKGTSPTPPDAMLSFNGINVGVYHGCTDDANRKIVIYLEGIDMLDFVPMLNRDVKQIYDGMIKTPKIAQLKNFGYDFYVVDWWNSRIDMRYNAMNVVRLIDYLKGQINNNFEFVVIGESMGGVIARYALTFMESPGYTNPTYWPYANRRERMHNTRLLITLDSPHQGANLPISVQLLYASIYNPTILFGAPMITNFIANNFDKFLFGMAAKQLLIYHVSTGGPNYGPAPERTAFLSDLTNLGNYPQYCKKMAISSGAIDGEMQTRFYSFTDRTPNDHLLNFSEHLYARILWFIKVGIEDINLDLRTNPNGSGSVMHLDIGIPGITINFHWFSISLFSTYNPIVYLDEPANVLPFCVNQGGYEFAAGAEVVGNSQSSSSIDWFSSFWLFNLYSWHSASDGNGCWSGAGHIGLDGFASANFDISACSDGMHFCFVPTQSALDYGTLGALPLNYNIEGDPITTKMANTPFDVIVGNASSDASFMGTHNLNRFHLYEKYIEDPITNYTGYLNAKRILQTDFTYCGTPPYSNIYGQWINKEIGDNQIYLDNVNVNWKSTFDASEDIIINGYNPWYTYAGFPGSHDGFYSRHNPFQILGSNTVLFKYDKYGTPSGTFVYNSPVSGTYSTDQSYGICSPCVDYSKRSLNQRSTLPTNSSTNFTVNIYPNPNTIDGILVINYQNINNKPVAITIYDILGKVLFTKQVTETDGKDIFTIINLSEYNIAKGFYTVTISDTENFVIKKLIIN